MGFRSHSAAVATTFEVVLVIFCFTNVIGATWSGSVGKGGMQAHIHWECFIHVVVCSRERNPSVSREEVEFLY